MTVLTTDVCADVEVIRWLYQFYIAVRRRTKCSPVSRRVRRLGQRRSQPQPQLFTPDWIVRYLVGNSLWSALDVTALTPRSLVDGVLHRPVEETEFLRIETPEEIKVMDPPARSGHMLTYAFDLLYAM